MKSCLLLPVPAAETIQDICTFIQTVTEVKSIHDHPEVCNTNTTNAGRNTVNIKTTLIVLKQAKSSFREMTVFI